MTTLDLPAVRRAFPGLSRQIDGQPAVFFDGPAGSQVPQRVADRVAEVLLHENANEGGAFVTSYQAEGIVADARETLGALLGTPDAQQELVFGPNMTTLTFAFSRALGATWQPDDEIVLSSLEHDANVTPWVLAAERAGVRVRHIAAQVPDCTLDLDDLRSKLSERTRLVAVSYASNAAGTIHPIRRITELAHEVGALVYVDAVHYAPHGPTDVADLGCDFLVASTYKFFGPHQAVLWGRQELLASLPAERLRPAPSVGPDRWMTGTASFEALAGAAEAVRYLADLSGLAQSAPLRSRLAASYAAIVEHEQALVGRLLQGLAGRPEWAIWGITDPARLSERVPTVSLTHSSIPTKVLASRLAERGIFCWSGSHYAVPLMEAAGLQSDGTLRLGMLHYNTADEVDRVLQALDAVG